MAAYQLERMIESGVSPGALASFLAANSHLPGPRGNLELAAAFADRCSSDVISRDRWDLLMEWASMSPSVTPFGGASEFLPFSALQALGAVYPSVDGARQRAIERSLLVASDDSRWRIREGVAMGLQRIGEADFGALRRILTGWLNEPSLFVQRAIMAALAHPPFLDDAGRAGYGLNVADCVLLGLLRVEPPERRSEGFRVLRKAMEYAPSVLVAALPEDGFALLGTWLERGDPLVAKIVRSNAGKARLAKRFPTKVAALLDRPAGAGG